jgi:hypothetical protein
MQAADTRIESSTESATAVRRGHIQKWRTRRVNLALCDVRTHMHRSGGRQPPVVYGNAAATAWRNCSRDIRPIHWRAPAQLRYHIHGGLTPAALASECERVPAKLRLLRCTNAHAPGAGASAPRGSRNRTGKGVRLLPWTNACAPGAGGVSPPWLAEPHRQGSATFAMPERMCTRSGGRQPPRGSRNRTGKGVRLLRCTNACAPGAGGLSTPWLAKPHRQGSATFATDERTCTGAGGVSPPWFTATHVQGRSRHGQRDCRPCTSDLRCSRDPTRLGTGCSSQNSATCISGLRRSRGATPTTTPTAG